jgi:hypothetical protein
MKRTAAVVCAAAIVFITASVLAQTPPSFAGKWTVVADPNAPTGGGRGMGGLGDTATIVQDATSLTITRTTQMGEFTSTYKLDGSDSKNTLNMAGNAIEMVSKVKSEAGKLVVNTSMNFNGNPVETTMTLSLDAGGNLLVESRRPDFQGGGGPITTKMTYKKN